MEQRELMLAAIEEAKLALEHGDVPVGCVIVRDGEVVARGHNRREEAGDPLAHAEMLALRAAAEALGGWRLDGCDIYVTLEPCPMCAGALAQARLRRLVYGVRDFKAGAAGTVFDLVRDPRLPHRLEVVDGICEEECRALLAGFFEEKRQEGG
jgi:tRNA(adenine34) deaminase